MVAGAPPQTVEAATVTVGKAFTVTVAVIVQPLVFL